MSGEITCDTLVGILGAMDGLRTRLTGYEYLPFPFSEDNPNAGVILNEVISTGGELEEPVVTVPEEKCLWTGTLDDANVAKKISSESWVRSFIKEIDDYPGKKEKVLNDVALDSFKIQGSPAYKEHVDVPPCL